jgi:hypothetical protein
MSTPSRAVAELGVGCVTCHVTEPGVVLAAPGHRANAPHPIRRSSEFGGAQACAGCHEFRFPGVPGHEDASFMQTTVREHAASGAGPCSSCHKPHAFAEVRDEAWLRDKLLIKAERNGARVKITLTQRSPGHAFPTGDLFRRLEVGCEIPGAARDVRYLARHFVVQEGTRGRGLVRDDRLRGEPVIVELALDKNGQMPAGVVHYWVGLQRVAQTGSGLDPSSAEIESEILLYSGDLP